MVLSGQDIQKFLGERTPEQTALIALRGLLEAKEMYLQKLEVCFTSLCSTSSKLVQTTNLTEICLFRLTQREQKCAQSSV